MISPQEAEARFAEAGLGGLSPEAAYDRAWAAELLHCALRSLRFDAIAAGRGDEFAVLSDGLLADPGANERRALAASLGISAVALRVRLHRLRERLRARVRSEVARTLGDRAGTNDELTELYRAAGRR